LPAKLWHGAKGRNSAAFSSNLKHHTFIVSKIYVYIETQCCKNRFLVKSTKNEAKNQKTPQNTSTSVVLEGKNRIDTKSIKEKLEQVI